MAAAYFIAPAPCAVVEEIRCFRLLNVLWNEPRVMTSFFNSDRNVERIVETKTETFTQQKVIVFRFCSLFVANTDMYRKQLPEADSNTDRVPNTNRIAVFWQDHMKLVLFIMLAIIFL